MTKRKLSLIIAFVVYNILRLKVQAIRNLEMLAENAQAWSCAVLACVGHKNSKRSTFVAGTLEHYSTRRRQDAGGAPGHALTVQRTEKKPSKKPLLYQTLLATPLLTTASRLMSFKTPLTRSDPATRFPSRNTR